MNIAKILLNYDIEDLKKIKFNLTKANNSVKSFYAAEIPRILEKTSEGIFNIEFDSDFSNIKPCSDEKN